MSATFKYDQSAAIAAMMFIGKTLGGEWDKYSLLKILYFAEMKHLAKYGRTITGDKFCALEHGPVPSHSYDFIKSVNGARYFQKSDDNVIKFIGDLDLDQLSESDIECLTESINENKMLGFGALKMKSHDCAYNDTVKTLGLNADIPITKVAEVGGANPSMVQYIEENIRLSNTVFSVPSAR